MAEHANVYPLRREPEREPQREREPQPEPRPQERQAQERQAQEPLWRDVLGRRLRVLRQEQQETLSETASRAGISPQYLSEIERGRKEPSSEMIAALAAVSDSVSCCSWRRTRSRRPSTSRQSGSWGRGSG